jgi:uncharacterized protein with ATP-grasp and redox domains
LRKKTEAAKKELDELAALVAKQSEKEQKALEAAEFGNEFDAAAALPQEKIVEAFQEALEGIEDAREGLINAVAAFKTVR